VSVSNGGHNNLPSKYVSIQAFEKDLEIRISEIKKEKRILIDGITCDISIRPSASKL